MKNAIYYVMLFTVILTWGIDPVINSFFYEHYSATALVSMATLLSAGMLLLVSIKKLKLLNRRYFAVAVPICGLNSIACVLQRIGLQYTTPASYAFLEQLACVVVPVALFAFTRKKPTFIQCAASVICLVGCFVLSGLGSEGGFVLGGGDILCAVAGILLGLCIAATGVFAKGFDIGLYMLVHMTVYFAVSLISAVGLNFITKGGVPLEKFVFSADVKILIPAALFSLFSVGVCWLFRTEALRNISPTFVAISNPLSAVITGVVSLISGLDTLTLSFAIGAVLIIFAMTLSSLSEKNNEGCSTEEEKQS